MVPSLDFSAVDSWADFTALAATLSERDRGTAFELLVRHYLRADPKYRAKLADVWLHHEVPADLRTGLNFPPRDEGIDLLVRTHAGEFWAVQAKYRTDTAATLTHRELATFTSLAFTVCRDIAFALVCTTTARIPGILSGLPNLGDLTAETWTTLGPDFFASLRASLATAAPPPLPRPRTPRLHQTKAIADAESYFADPARTRGKLIHPCGSGKSLTAYWIARTLGARRILVAVPSLALVRQTLETWMTEMLADGRPADWLCVCSDDEVATVDHEALVAHVHELGIPCDTAPDALAGHLRAAAPREAILVVLTTYQSSPVLAAAARTAGFAFDFAVLDEAHKTTGKTSGHFAHLLRDENLPLPRRLFMTATERRFASSRTDDIVSMDDPALYGETIDLLTFKAAIAADPPILCDYRLLTIGVRASEVAALVAGNRWLDLGPAGLDEITALALASLVALRRATAHHGVRHAVSFHSSIARAAHFRKLCQRLNDHLPDTAAVQAFHVTGKMGSAARQRELDAFLAAAPSLVTNARCLTEGVDLPGIDCVFFADPKGSTIDIVQAAGRALRLAPGKTRGYILLPLVIPDGATPDDVVNGSAFKFILFVLRALATHDERIIEWFRAKAEGRVPEVGGIVDFDFGEVSVPLGIDAAEFANAIAVTCWESIARLSFAPYEQARMWARKLDITSGRAWGTAYKQLTKSGEWPADIPRAVDRHYRGTGWTDWPEFLGVGEKYIRYVGGKAGRKLLPFDEARSWAHTLGLKSLDQWLAFVRSAETNLRSDVPSWPDRHYKNKGWIGWPDFLGYSDAWRPFCQARDFARTLKLTGQREWKQYAKGGRPDLAPKPEDIPASPWSAYAEIGWCGWRDWLGTEKPATKTPSPATPKKPRKPRQPRPSRFLDFQSARAFAQSLSLKSSTEWYAYTHGRLSDQAPKPADIPSSPHNVYADHWQGWGDWLGTGNVAPFEKKFRSFEAARAFARTLGFRTGEDWKQWSVVPGNRPVDVPSAPDKIYAAQGWISWSDFLQPPPV